MFCRKYQLSNKIFRCCTVSFYLVERKKTRKIINIIVIYVLPSIFFLYIYIYIFPNFSRGLNFANDNFRDILRGLYFVNGKFRNISNISIILHRKVQNPRNITRAKTNPLSDFRKKLDHNCLTRS